MIDGQLGMAKNILFNTTTVETFILRRSLLDLAPLYTDPINSPDIGIFTACELAAEVKVCKLSDIEAKYVLLPLGFGWAASNPIAAFALELVVKYKCIFACLFLSFLQES